MPMPTENGAIPLGLASATGARLKREQGGLGTTRVILTRSGEAVDVSGDLWQASADQTISLAAFRSHEGILTAVRAYLETLLATRSARYASNVASWLRKLGSPEVVAKFKSDLQDTGKLTIGCFRAFEKANLGLAPDWQNGVRGAYIRWYLWCCDTGLEAFDEDVATELSSIILPRGAAGVAVMRSDPHCGPLPPAEFNNLISQLRAAVGRRWIDPADLAIAWLLAAFGTNPLNMRLLFEEDLLKTELSDGSVVYELRIPRIKKRTSKLRSQFRTRELEPAIGQLIERVIYRNADLRKVDPTSAQDAHRVLFRTERPRPDLVNTPFSSWALQVSKGWPIAALRRVVAQLGIQDLSGEPLHLTPRRLRYTFATNLVEDGATPMEVADALDHTTVDHVMVYFNSRADVVHRLDASMGGLLAPLAQAFLGTVVRSSADARRGDEVESVIRYYSPAMRAVKPVGNCGTYAFCDLAAPLACYTCSDFQPWLNADHESVLNGELAKRAKKLARGADPRWTQIHDKTIAAIQYVVVRCRQLLDHGA